MVRETACWLRNSRCAARPKCSPSATATNSAATAARRPSEHHHWRSGAPRVQPARGRAGPYGSRRSRVWSAPWSSTDGAGAAIGGIRRPPRAADAAATPSTPRTAAATGWASARQASRARHGGASRKCRAARAGPSYPLSAPSGSSAPSSPRAPGRGRRARSPPGGRGRVGDLLRQPAELVPGPGPGSTPGRRRAGPRRAGGRGGRRRRRRADGRAEDEHARLGEERRVDEHRRRVGGGPRPGRLVRDHGVHQTVARAAPPPPTRSSTTSTRVPGRVSASAAVRAGVSGPSRRGRADPEHTDPSRR